MRAIITTILACALGCGGADESEPAYGDSEATAPAISEAAPHPAQSVDRTAVDRPMTEEGELAVLLDGERVPVATAIVIRHGDPGTPDELVLFGESADCAVVRETPFERDDVLARVTLPNGALGSEVDRRVTVTSPLDDERVELEGPMVAEVCDLAAL